MHKSIRINPNVFIVRSASMVFPIKRLEREEKEKKRIERREQRVNV